jgi:TonB family protein
MKTKILLFAGVIALCLASGHAQQSDVQPPQQLLVPQSVMQENLIRKVAPEYPEEVRAKQIQGQVIVSIAVDKKGDVTEAKVVDGNPLLGAAAVKAIEQWKFRPYLLNGEAVDVSSSITVNFRLKPPVPAESSVPLESSVPPGADQGPRRNVRSGVMEGNLIRRVDPSYPLEAKVRHIQGDVILSAVITKDGNIAELRVVKGDPILAKATLQAVKQWKYRPYTLEGEPVEVITTVTVRFHM